MMDVAFLSAVVYALVEAVKEQFPVLEGQLTRLIALGLGVLLAFGTDVRLLAEYGSVADWLDAVVTGAAVGLGVPTVFYKTAQAVALRQTTPVTYNYTTSLDV
jgi:putative effector of murein hydrolase